MKKYLIIMFSCLLLALACAPSAARPMEGKLRVIAEIYPPYNFVDKDKNITGQSVEIVQAMLKKLGLSAPIEIMALSDGMMLAKKGPNMIVFSINKTPQREALYKWVGPIGEYRQLFYAKRGSSIAVNKLEDARVAGKISVYQGDAGNQFLVSKGFTNLDESRTDVEALKKLMNGSVQLWLGNEAGLAVTAQEAGVNPDELVAVPYVITRADLYVALSPDFDDATVASWQKALDSLKQDRETDGKTVYEKITGRYADVKYVQGLLK